MEAWKRVDAELYFLERSNLWDKEKPFQLDYVPEPPALKSNSLVVPQSIQIEDIRGREDEFTYQKHGFCVLPLVSGMSSEDFDDEAKLRGVYLRAVGDAVKIAVGAARVQVYDYTVRKRNAQFPWSTGGFYSHKQPASIAHVDTTPADMQRMRSTLGESSPDVLEYKHYQSINVWKPLRGPLRDWPLAICDCSSVNEEDLRARDNITRDSFTETYQVHYKPEQRWYYISDQIDTEAWLFLQGDSLPGNTLGAPHSSFDWPFTTSADLPRESIEVRCMAYFDN